MMKFWEHVKERLENIENTNAYYVGGTLCVNVGKTNEVAMNLDGTGFIVDGKMKNGKVYLPDPITKLVRKIYKRIKGKTTHYEETKARSRNSKRT